MQYRKTINQPLIHPQNLINKFQVVDVIYNNIVHVPREDDIDGNREKWYRL